MPTHITPLLVVASQYAQIPAGEATEAFVAITLHAPAVENAVRSPLALSVALDVSGSMAGQKIQSAKDSLLKLVDHLAPNDVLGVVTFSAGVEVVLPVTKMDTFGKNTARAKINQIGAQGSTNFSGGLFKAFDLLHEADLPPTTIKRVLTFTDGEANAGIVGKPLLEATAKYAKGVGLSTFGYGAQHDSDLLSALAQSGGFYFINSPEAILAAFGSELGGLLATYGQNVQLMLEAGQDVDLVEVLNELKSTRNEDGDLVIECDDLLSEQDYVVVVKVKTSPGFSGAILIARVQFTHTGKAERVEFAARLKVAVGPLSEVNKKVLDEVAYQKGVRVQTVAMGLANAGDIKGARGVLNDFIGFATSIGTEDSKELGLMASALMGDAYADAASYSMNGRHTSNSVKSSMGKRRGYSEVPAMKGLATKYGSSGETATRAAFSNTPAPRPATPAPVPPTKK